ncbi:MAG: hypothetical protein WCD48_20290 [Candidatus Sulfotelmatobacter sp.]|jgi:hypothetical protein
MGRKLLVFLLFCGGVELSAQTVVQQFVAVSAGAGTVSDMDLPKPSGKGSVLIAMPVLLSPGVKVLSVSDNAPDGGNTYKQVPGTSSSCAEKSLDIWYCENCNPGVTELKFHLSDHVKGSLNAFLEVSGMALSSVLDGTGAQVSNGTATSGDLEVGPSITTTTKDFIIARYFSTAPLPTGVTPAGWKYSTSYVYFLNAPSGTYQPTLTGGRAAGSFCMGMAAFKTAAAVASSPPDRN